MMEVCDMGLLTWFRGFLRRLEEANVEQFGEEKKLDCCDLPGKHLSKGGAPLSDRSHRTDGCTGAEDLHSGGMR